METGRKAADVRKFALSFIEATPVTHNRQNGGTTKKSKTTMKNNANSALATIVKSGKKKNHEATRREAEANARRMASQKWEKLGRGLKYRKATARFACRSITAHLKEELFDGILINLRGKNSEKSYSVQKRVLRRIVEKRQAQQTHRHVGRTDDLFSGHMSRHCTSISMKELKRYQWGA